MSGAEPQGEQHAEQRTARRAVASMLASDAFSRWLGIDVTSIRPREVTATMTVRAEMTNGFGVCHGGVTFALADSALAFASNTHGQVTVSVENSISYPAAVHAGDVLTAHAVQETAARRLAFYRVRVTNQHDAVVALFRGTVYRTDRPLDLTVEDA